MSDDGLTHCIVLQSPSMNRFSAEAIAERCDVELLRDRRQSRFVFRDTFSGDLFAEVGYLARDSRGWAIQSYQDATDRDRAALAQQASIAATGGLNTSIRAETKVCKDGRVWMWWRACIREPVDEIAREMLAAVDFPTVIEGVAL